MFPKKKLAALTIIDPDVLSKRLKLLADSKKRGLIVKAKFQNVSHERFLVVDFCGLQEQESKLVLRGMYSKDNYWYYDPEKQKFSHRALSDHLWRLKSEIVEYADPQSRKIADKFFRAREFNSLANAITQYEYICMGKISKKRRERKLQKEAELENILLPLPKDAIRYNHKMAPHFLIRESDKYTCTCCGKEMAISKKEKPFKHLQVTTCPNCGKEVTVQLRTKMKHQIDTLSWTAVMQRTTDGGHVMRYLLFDRLYKKEEGVTYLRNEEVARMYAKPDGTIHYSEKYGNVWEPTTRSYFAEPNAFRANRYFCGYSFLYPNGLADALSDIQGCEYYTDGMFEEFSKYNIRWYYMLWDFLGDETGDRAYVYEELLKLGFHEMVKGLIMDYRQPVKYSKEPLPKVFGFNTQTFKRWSKVPTLEHYCFLKDMPEELSEKDYTVYTETFGFQAYLYREFHQMNICKVITYLKKQVDLCLQNGRYRMGKRTSMEALLKSMLSQWYHYIRLMKKLYGEHLNEQMIFPKDFYEADERATAEDERRQEEKRALMDQTYRETAAKISEALRNDKDIQQFMEGCEGLKVFVPTSPEELRREGARMGNCLATYVNDVAQGNTSIFFIRKINKPDTEYFAMEYRDGEIRQLHGKGNCNDTTGKVTAFADAFANVLRAINWQPVRFAAA